MIERENRSGGNGILHPARRAPRRRRCFQMADPKIGGASLTRAELREEFDRFRDEMHRELRHYATKADVANLKTWMVGLLLVVVLNVLGTAGAIVAAVLTR